MRRRSREICKAKLTLERSATDGAGLCVPLGECTESGGRRTILPVDELALESYPCRSAAERECIVVGFIRQRRQTADLELHNQYQHSSHAGGLQHFLWRPFRNG